MNHWLVAPVLLPLLSAAVLLWLERARPAWQAPFAVVSTAALLAVAQQLLQLAATGQVSVYLVGNWSAPFGIALALDRLGALMLFLTALLGFAALLSALERWHQRGPHFHALLQLQFMGLNGAFLTADLFNLFVFFEVLLAASYGLLLHGGGSGRLRAGLHYVALNAVGAALFLVAVALLYALTGTLNLADLARRVPLVPAPQAGLVKAAALLLLTVFMLKAAVLPLSLWLPDTYRAAAAPVAALFAIMTKLGVFAVLRVYPLVFGVPGEDRFTATLLADWLLPPAALTVLLAGLGVLAARDLRLLAGFFAIASAGLVLAVLAPGGAEALAAALFYLVPGTLAVAALFLLAEWIARQRPDLGDALIPGPAMPQAWLAGGVFFVLALTLVGLPPLPGFFGKLLMLRASLGQAGAAWIWAAVLGGSLCALIAVSRAGSRLFWNVREPLPDTAGPAATALAPILLLCGCLVALVPAAGGLERYAAAAARQLLDRDGYVAAVLGAAPTERRP